MGLGLGLGLGSGFGFGFRLGLGLGRRVPSAVGATAACGVRACAR